VAEKAGAYYLPDINVLDLRVQKEFAFKRTQRLQLMLNLFNFFESKTVTGVVQGTVGFREPTNHLSGTVVRFSTRYTF